MAICLGRLRFLLLQTPVLTETFNSATLRLIADGVLRLPQRASARRSPMRVALPATMCSAHFT